MTKRLEKRYNLDNLMDNWNFTVKEDDNIITAQTYSRTVKR